MIEMFIVEMCKGNPGALAFIMDALSKNPLKAEQAFERMRENRITGAKLYMFWNDCCNRDTEKAVDIMMSHTIEDIIQHINYENGRGIVYENADADDISDFGKCLGYSNMPCPNCGRIRLENYENGKQVCEKCQWCPQENGYVDVFALRNEREKNDYFSFFSKDDGNET